MACLRAVGVFKLGAARLFYRLAGREMSDVKRLTIFGCGGAAIAGCGAVGVARRAYHDTRMEASNMLSEYEQPESTRGEGMALTRQA